MAKDAKRETVTVEEFEVRRAYEFKNGNIAFDLTLNGITFYGLTVVKGKKGDFISFPQRAVKSGKETNYYNYFWIPLDEDDQADIIEAVSEKLEEDYEEEEEKPRRKRK